MTKGKGLLVYGNKVAKGHAEKSRHLRPYFSQVDVCQLLGNYVRQDFLWTMIPGVHTTIPSTASTMLWCIPLSRKPGNLGRGLPVQHISYVKNIDSGLPLFLFNYTDRKLYGIYEAAGSGQMHIDKYAWTSDGSFRNSSSCTGLKTLRELALQREFSGGITDVPSDEATTIVVPASINDAIIGQETINDAIIGQETLLEELPLGEEQNVECSCDSTVSSSNGRTESFEEEYIHKIDNLTQDLSLNWLYTACCGGTKHNMSSMVINADSDKL
ncbi:hypothetical protein RND71_038494 [Anisodus tanguticus]|uniref:DCD domain-containing protein n=1 Tax=Anisodus tanguticus TaxID=243964 RepID=A0AAE1R0L0_9SOLA|nr:hypothetical protein RND71_038494 [Anisodus tanguticus]